MKKANIPQGPIVSGGGDSQCLDPSSSIAQQLKVEIAALAIIVESAFDCSDEYSAAHFILKKLRQLSTF